MSGMTNNPFKLARMAGYYKGIQSAGAAVSFGMDAVKVSLFCDASKSTVRLTRCYSRHPTWQSISSHGCSLLSPYLWFFSCSTKSLRPTMGPKRPSLSMTWSMYRTRQLLIRWSKWPRNVVRRGQKRDGLHCGCRSCYRVRPKRERFLAKAMAVPLIE